MKRLTFEGNFCDISMCRENPCPYNGACSQRKVWERLKEYEDREEQNQWISVNERLPDEIDSYLVVVKFKYDWEKQYTIATDVAVFRDEDYPYGGYYIDGRWQTYNDWYEGQEDMHITHWMPIPTPPEGGAE